MTSRTLGVKVEEETWQTLELLARWRAAPRGEMASRLLQEGARQARLEYAAELYRQQEVTLERAADVAAVSIYDMMAYLRQQGISRPSHIEEMRADVAAMLIRSGRSDIAEHLAS